ncbi:FAD-dependent oxidoreductase [Frigidibacter sp. SD6-1]|uniref:NAD(P)/FAD-dependent oxidoreductase n=1 Tax=Frigidibacter sp. SD6-1 TaxID=3032581 RepID=UPI0024E00F4B|nr:FAD-dependent oxidoreductase [Frigidibacter sp. SD6-1]
MPSHYDCIIVGAGHGGAQSAVALRDAGYSGSIALIGAEPEVPYDRPSLSKEYLAGKKSFERMQLRPTDFWESRSIDLLPDRRVTAVDAVRKTVATADSSIYSYDRLIWATGGEPRRLTCVGSDLSGIFYIRNKADCDALMAALPYARKTVVVGGGYIGLEAAAVLRELGKDVTLVEAKDRVLARVAGEYISRFYEAEHRRHGVHIKLGTGLSHFTGRAGRLEGLVLDTGEILPADLAIVGVGIIPAVQPLLAAGAEGGNGVDVDEFCRTSLPDVYCVGDCACMRIGQGLRIESLQNANDQATVAAKAIAGNAVPYRATPWFWSNQYDLRLQTVGLSAGHDETVIRGNPEERRFSVVYLRRGTVIALDCINSPKDCMQGRKLVEAGLGAAPAVLATVETLKELLLHDA